MVGLSLVPLPAALCLSVFLSAILFGRVLVCHVRCACHVLVCLCGYLSVSSCSRPCCDLYISIYSFSICKPQRELRSAHGRQRGILAHFVHVLRFEVLTNAPLRTRVSVRDFPAAALAVH